MGGVIGSHPLPCHITAITVVIPSVWLGLWVARNINETPTTTTQAMKMMSSCWVSAPNMGNNLFTERQKPGMVNIAGHILLNFPGKIAVMFFRTHMRITLAVHLGEKTTTPVRSRRSFFAVV